MPQKIKKEWRPKEDDKGTAENRDLKDPSGSEVPQYIYIYIYIYIYVCV